MKRRGTILAAAMLILGMAGIAAAETTLEKIKRTGIFTIGTRTGSPPFAYINKQNEWGGFSIDLARLVQRNVEKKLGAIRKV